MKWYVKLIYIVCLRKTVVKWFIQGNEHNYSIVIYWPYVDCFLSMQLITHMLNHVKPNFHQFRRLWCFSSCNIEWIIIAMFETYPQLSSLEPFKSVYSFPGVWYYWPIWKRKHPPNAGETGCWWKWFHWACTDYQPSSMNMFVGFLSQNLSFVKSLYNHLGLWKWVFINSTCSWTMFDTFQISCFWAS